MRGFRNLGVQELTFPREGVAILGGNAQGKSNLLEAIYYLETLRSFRGSGDAQLVAFGCTVFRIEGDLAGDADPVQVAAAFDRGSRRKRVYLDGDPQDTLAAGLGRVGAVIFSPDDIRMINGPPAERRRFLDVVLSLNVPGYVEMLQRYRRALAQRNAALKASEGPTALEGWSRMLASSGSVLVCARARWIAERAGSFSAHYEAVSGAEVAALSYRPSVDEDETLASTEARILSALVDAERRDRRLRTTTVGPHRDEMAVVLEGADREVREFGSGGQRRTAALALRLVEADTVRDVRDPDPLVLMDDVFAELDQARSDRLLARIEGGRIGQVILTAPKEADVRVRRDALPRWQIEGGRVAA